MQRLIPVFIFIILLYSCKKSESDFIWEKTYGKGEALFIRTSSDSGFVACGEIGGNPYFILLNKTRSLIADFKAEYPGLFSSVWFDKSGYIAGGNTGGKMLLMRFTSDGSKMWDESLDAGFRIDYTRLCYTGDGNFLAVGTASPDSSGSGATGLFLVRFDTTGQVTIQKKVEESSFISANGAVVDNTGNIFLALTRKAAGAKPRASVAKFNNQFQKLWETELYNNPGFGSASLAIKLDRSGNVYVAGKTELSGTGGVLNNSFMVSLTNTGSISWKRYLENSNSGASFVFDDMENLMILNKNCFIINILNHEDGSDAGIIHAFSLCDSFNTDALGADLDLDYAKNILVAGSYGGSFYLALKSSL